MLGAVAFVVLPFAHAGGGRDAGWAAAAALAVALAVAVTRPWTRVGRLPLVLAAALAGLSLSVLLTTGVGRAGSVAALAYGLAAGLFVAVAAYARSSSRALAVAGVVCVGAVAQFGWALVPWWGGADPSRPMVGTYYWHNQFAAALLAPALLGLALLLDGRPMWRSLGWVTAPLSVAGIVFSTSRATLACLVVGWVAVGALGLIQAKGKRAVLGRAVIASAASVGLVLLLAGPPLFTHRVSPWSGTQDRSTSGETLQSNGTYRTQFWREAVAATADRPMTGVGYGRLAEASGPLVPETWAHSSLAHSGVLQAFADGGLPLGAATTAAIAALVVALIGRVRRSLIAPEGRGLVGPASAVAALALLAHSLVDADWSYAALAGVFGIVAALGVSGMTTTETTPGRLRLGAAAVLVAALAVGAVAAVGEPFHINVAASVPPMGGAR